MIVVTATKGALASTLSWGGDPGVARPGRDGDGRPDRHAGHGCGEEQLGERCRAGQERQRLGEEGLLTTDRGGEHRLQGALLSLPGHRIGRDHGRDDRREGQHVDQR